MGETDAALHTGKGHLRCDISPDQTREIGIVVAANPAPLSPFHQSDEQLATIIGQASRPSDIMEAVTEANHMGRIKTVDVGAELFEALVGIIGRQENWPRMAKAEPFSKCKSAMKSVSSRGR